MVVKVVGIEKQDFTFPDGKQYSGKKLHCVVVDRHEPNLVGCPTEVVKIASTSEFFSVPIDVDSLYTIFFDQKGKIAFLAPAK